MPLELVGFAVVTVVVWELGVENMYFDKPGREGGLMQENEAANAVMRVLWLFE